MLSALTLGEIREGVEKLGLWLEHGLRLVTRNTRDFDYAGLALINPWETVG